MTGFNAAMSPIDAHGQDGGREAEELACIALIGLMCVPRIALLAHQAVEPCLRAASRSGEPGSMKSWLVMAQLSAMTVSKS